MFVTGVLQALSVTLRHLLEARRGTAVGRERRANGIVQTPGEKGIFTVQYPEEKLAVPERFRYFPMLLYDAETGRERCTSCGICAKVCPPQCIWIVRTTGPDGKPVPEPKEFYIDLSICMSCGYCAEYCPFDAIKMNHVYELATNERRIPCSIRRRTSSSPPPTMPLPTRAIGRRRKQNGRPRRKPSAARPRPVPLDRPLAGPPRHRRRPGRSSSEPIR